MIDHLLGRPSTKLKRFQVFSVIFFWLWFLGRGKRERSNPLIRRFNQKFKRFSPWQLVVFSSVGIYAIRHLDSLLGFGSPEPLARMYARNFYRTTWIVTALDAGFATAMNVKPKWLRDILSMVFTVYYAIYANEADEKLRKYRAFCTVEMMRTTWEKTTNPYIRLFTWFHRPSLPIARPLLVPRPAIGAHHSRPTKAWLFYAKSERQLRMEEELVVDLCGGGYICMNPQHHEERLRQLAKQMQKPVLAVDYCKAPEYPYPFALEECYDLYRTLHETAGKVIGMSGSANFRIILTGDSAGGNLATGVVLKVIEYPQTRIQAAYATAPNHKQAPSLPKPIGVLLSYPSLNFGFSSWMKPEHLRLLRQQSEVNLDNLAQHENLTASASESSVRSQRRRSAVNLASGRSQDRKKTDGRRGRSKDRHHDQRLYRSLTQTAELHLDERAKFAEVEPTSDENGSGPDTAYDRVWAESTLTPSYEADSLPWRQVDRQAHLDRVADQEEKRAQAKFEKDQQALQKVADAADDKTKEQRRSPFNTRLTVTSMAGYFQDRIISQGMLRAMAILYIGPKRQPDLDNDYYLSPVVAPAHLLAEFPPVLFICGEKDPICDDTVVMAGKIREAKLAKQADLLRRRVAASSRFGEGLRTTPISSSNAPVDPIETESPEDWVQMRIIEGWSHGFLQMSSLMPEAKQVIKFLGTWMSIVFEDYADKLDEERRIKGEAKRIATGKALASRQGSPLAPDKSLPSVPTLALPNAAKTNEGVAKSRVELSVPQGNDADDEDDGDDGALMLIPKGGRRLSNRTASPLSGSPKIPSPGKGSEALPDKSKDHHGSPKPPQLELLRAQLREERATSLSDSETTFAAQQRASRPATTQAFSIPGRADSDSHLSSQSRHGSTPRRSSKNGPSHLDEKYRAMLVEETSLLARRRDDVLYGLENNSAVVHSDDESRAQRQQHRSRSRDTASTDEAR